MTDIQKIFEKNNIKLHIRTKCINLVSFIKHQQLYYKKKPHQFIPIKSQVIKAITTCNFYKIVTNLVFDVFKFANRDYKDWNIGEQPIKYRVNPEWIDYPFPQIKKELLNRLIQINMKKKNTNGRKKKDLIRTRNEGFLETYRIQLFDEKYRILYELHKELMGEDEFFTSSPKTGKIYSKFCQLSPDKRHELKFRGEEISGWDVSGLYPLLLNIRLKKQPNYSESEDMKLYSELTQNGKFYEHWNNLLIKEGIILPYISVAKDRFLSSVFNSAYKPEYRLYRYEIVFKKYFPDTWKVINDMKREFGFLCHWCFVQERSLMVDMIGLPLAKNNIPVWVVHDCIYTTLPNMNKVKKVIETVFHEAAGLKVNLKEK